MVKIFFLGFILSTSLLAQDTLLKCLGREEAKLFKNRTEGSIARLNQDLILEFIQFSAYQPLTSSYFSEICEGQDSPSFKLLTALFRHQRAIFKKPNSNEVNDFMKKIPSIFLKLVAQVKTYGEDLKCVHQVLPELKKLDQIILSYQQEKSAELLFYKNPLALKILTKLPSVLPRLRNCRQTKTKDPDPKSEYQTPPQ